MAKLEDVCDINMGQSPDSITYNDIGEGLPFFQGNADFGEKNPTVRVWCNLPIKIANKGDILISVRAPIGAMNIANNTCCIGRGLAAITVNSEICNANYLWYCLDSKIEELKSKGTGSTFKAINKKALGETAINIRSLDEQCHIAAVLDKVSELIALRKRQLDLLDELVKARFVEMFGDPVRNEKGWKYFLLQELCDDIGDGLHGTPSYDEDGKFAFINGNNLLQGRIIINSTTKRVNNMEYKKYFIDISSNAVLISINGSLGKLAYYNNEEIILGKSACYCNLKNGINKVFVFHVMNSDPFQNFLEKSSTKSTIKNVGLKAIREYKMIQPPIELQNQFADFVHQIDKSKDIVQQGLDRLELLKSALMQEYFG